jgi:CheY-like chemotaxis protein
MILIVDSSTQIIERWTEIIEETENPTEVHSAVFYEEALKLCKQNVYDAILLDIDLPGNGSLKLVKEIKKDGRNPSIIILFTYIDSYMLAQCRSLGIEFFYDKYYDFEKICGLLGDEPLVNTGEDLDETKNR